MTAKTSTVVRSDASVSPFIFDGDRLHTLASDGVIRAGMAYLKDKRVLSVGTEEGRLVARVEGWRTDLHWDVEIEAGDDGELTTSCGCDFHDEPTCKHVVAALLAHAAQVESEQVASAADRALSDRQHRGKTEVRVRHVTGAPTFGTWTAHTVTDPNAPMRPYTVQLRSVHERLNTCTCPDFAVNRLGTCKHIEGVLHQLKKRRARVPRLSHALVYLHWELNDGADFDGAPTIRVRRSDQPSPELTAVIDRHFDARGVLRGSLPDAWARLEEDALRRVDIDLGEDARAHASRAAMAMARSARATAIAEAIQRSGGHLPGVKARLYPYQTEGVAFLASNGRAMLADDMGLGKTLQAIAAARWLVDHEGVTRVLVVCPASLKTQWQREIQRFTGLDAVVIEGGPAPRHAQYRRGATFTIANYELVMRDLTALSEELRPDLLIVDEAQRLKNWRTKGAAAVKSLRTRYAFVLTGTPLENRLEDLYSIMQVVDGHVLGPLWHFMPRYHVLDARETPVGFRNLSELRRRLRTVMLRRDKRLVRDQLPQRIVQTIPVMMTEAQTNLHDGCLQRAGRYAKILERRPLTPGEEKELLAALLGARLACNAAGLLDKVTVGSPKLDELARILEAVCVDGGEKVVVFSQWETMTRMAEDVATGLGLTAVRLHGRLDTRQRRDVVDRFCQDPDAQVFISTDAGATGLNLQVASVFVNLDLPWNPALLEQRIGRVYRLGQKQAVHVYLLIAAGSYEERIGMIMRTKAQLFQAVVEEEDEGSGDGEVVVMNRSILDLATEAANDLIRGLLPKSPDEVEVPETTPPEDAGPETGPVDAEPLPDPEAEPDALKRRAAPDADDTDGVLRRAITLAEQTFGSRIDTLIARPTGLVLLMQDVSDGDIAKAEAIAREFPIAVMERRTWAALERMGLGTGETVESPPALPPPEAPVEPPLRALARKRLAAAHVVHREGMTSTALELIAGALLAHVAAIAGLTDVPNPQGAALWLYGEAVPKGWATTELAGEILKAQGLALAPAVPDGLVLDLLATAAGALAAT